ncbi:MAG: hypothetical protein IKH26_11775 [Bacteroidaceae bacterium]|nr:hypothetical protein [Bacteroidaceae bacterium]
MGNNIQELAEKLLHEGVEKGNAEADRIIAAAKEKAASIVKAANEEAKNIVDEAKKKANELDNNTKAELKMFNAQSVNALKSEIANVVGDKIVKQTVNDVTGDKNFLHEFILRLAEKWAGGEDIVISTADSNALKALFAAKAKALLDKNVTIKQVNGNPTSFVIGPADGSYKVNFGEEEFENYFKSFLRPQLIDMLF